MKNSEYRSPLPVNFQVDEYQIFRCIGADASALYYKVHHRKNSAEAILKEIYPYTLAQKKCVFRSLLTNQVEGDQSLSTRYEKLAEESTLMAFLSSPLPVSPRLVYQNHIPYGLYPSKGAYLLRQRMKQSTQQGAWDGIDTLKEVLQMVKGILMGLSTIHDAGYLVGDIAPDNLLVQMGVNGIPTVQCLNYVSGFLLENKRSQTFDYRPGYAPPEFYVPDQMHRVDYHSDLFSVGAVLFEMLFATQYKLGVHKKILLKNEPMPSYYFQGQAPQVAMATWELLQKALAARIGCWRTFVREVDAIIAMEP
ncbi:hypothetical protein RFF05_13215 [Bengtsoniella intestinalis]|uniref:protein kinase domain-containing protein n=1 Tax=Bengtsoniella intestinalis TaxID=3073143 RepID=UPI00391F940A